MKKAKIRRLNTSAEGTFGKLFVDGQFVCVTGELPRYAGKPDKENERSTDCIPAGTYVCKIRNSPKFGLAYEVKDVPGRTYVMIHKGNWCGEKHGYLDNQKAVLSSSSAYKRFRELMNDEDFELTIEWA